MSERILLVEDDDRLAELVVEYLSQAGYELTREANGALAAERILNEQPDLVILDVMLPGESGLSVLRKVRDRYEGPVLMLTARDDPTDEVIGLELGSDDYVAKPVRPRVLLARIQALFRRQRPSGSSDVIEDGDLTADRGRREVRLGGERVDLTTAEFELLWFLLSRAGQPVTRDDLFRELRGIEYDGLDRSMDVRVSQLRKRLFTDNGRPSRIVTVRGTGYQFTRARG